MTDIVDRPNYGRRRLPRYRAHVWESSVHAGVHLTENGIVTEIWSSEDQASNLMVTILCDEIDDRDAEIETLRTKLSAVKEAVRAVRDGEKAYYGGFAVSDPEIQFADDLWRLL